MGKPKPSQGISNGNVAAASSDVKANVHKLESFLRENENYVLQRDNSEGMREENGSGHDALRGLEKWQSEAYISRCLDAGHDALRGLEKWQSEAYISRLADNNIRALNLLKQCLHTTRNVLAGQNSSKGAVSVAVKDMEGNPAESVHKQYSDMVLWTETARLNAKIFAAAEKQAVLKSEVEARPEMRDVYIGQVTEAFGDELDKLRVEGNLHAGRVVALAEALEQGKDIWSADEIAMWCAPAGRAVVHSTRQR